MDLSAHVLPSCSTHFQWDEDRGRMRGCETLAPPIAAHAGQSWTPAPPQPLLATGGGARAGGLSVYLLRTEAPSLRLLSL